MEIEREFIAKALLRSTYMHTENNKMM